MQLLWLKIKCFINYNCIHGTLKNLIYTRIPSRSLSFLWLKWSATKFRWNELDNSVSRDMQSCATKYYTQSSCKGRSFLHLFKSRCLGREECLMLSSNSIKLQQPSRDTLSRFGALDKFGNSLNSFNSERKISFNCGSSCNN